MNKSLMLVGFLLILLTSGCGQSKEEYEAAEAAKKEEYEAAAAAKLAIICNKMDVASTQEKVLIAAARSGIVAIRSRSIIRGTDNFNLKVSIEGVETQVSMQGNIHKSYYPKKLGLDSSKKLTNNVQTGKGYPMAILVELEDTELKTAELSDGTVKIEGPASLNNEPGKCNTDIVKGSFWIYDPQNGTIKFNKK